MTNTIASEIKFLQLCKLFERISTVPKNKKGVILDLYISSFREFADKYKKENDPETDISFHPILRLLLPDLDRERGPYGIKEHTLAQIYIRVIRIPKTGIDGEKLLNYRAPKSAGNKAGDFAEVASSILEKYCSGGENLTVKEINEHLDIIAERNAANDRRGVENELQTLFRLLSPSDQKWLIRILLKDLKLGIGHKRIMWAYHPDANDLFDVNNDLKKVCMQLRDPAVRLHEVQIEMFSSFNPMLAEQCDVKKIDEFFKDSSYYYVETKHDGERFQIHYKDGEFRYFSRNGYDYTNNFGKTCYDGTITPRLAKQLKREVKNCILDGEMMCWHKEKRFFRTKGENCDVKNLKADSVLQPCFCIFDVVMCNDIVLTNKPLEERHKYLSKIFVPEEGTITFTEQKKVSTKTEVIDELNNAINMKLEGIMLKRPQSAYKPNNRKAGWYKIKPEYTDGLMDHLDLLIIGGYYGEGRRSGFIGQFLLGLAVPCQEDVPKEFHSLARVGSGYTVNKLETLLSKLESHWYPVNPLSGQCPSGIQWGRDKPDVWIKPENSFILEVKATEIIEDRMNNFKIGYTLRFPRVEDIRYDKKWNECLTVSEFEALHQQADGKLYSKLISTDEEGSSPRKKKKVVSEPAEVAPHFSAADLAAVEKLSDFLEGKEFCVLTEHGGLTKHDVEQTIYQHGGKIVQNPGANTYCVLADKVNLRVSNIIKCQKHNMATISWLFRCLEQGKLVTWCPSDLLSMTDLTKEEMRKYYDKYGDGYCELATMKSLEYVFRQIKRLDEIGVPKETEMADLDMELFGGPSPYGIFRLCVAFMGYEKVENCNSTNVSCMKTSASLFLFYGGIIEESITERTTHIIIDSSDMNMVLNFQNINCKREKKFHLVPPEWVFECVKEKKRLGENMHFNVGTEEVI